MIQDNAAFSAVEFTDDRLRETGELVERCNNLPPWEVSGFAETYLRGGLNLRLLRRVFGEQANCGFVWSRADPAGRNGSKGFDCVTPARNDESSRCNSSFQQSYVLSDNVQIVQGAKELIPIWSSVRFQRLDDTSFLGGQGLYEFVPFVSLPREEDCPAAGDRKVSIINKRLAVSVCERRRQNVETASNGIEINSCFDLETERERLFCRDYNYIVRNIRWQLSDIHIHVFAEPSIKPFLKEWEIGFGPIDRCLSVRQIIAHGQIRSDERP
jgi:hypothetical protein